jgi:hypothetical protein
MGRKGHSFNGLAEGTCPTMKLRPYPVTLLTGCSTLSLLVSFTFLSPRWLQVPHSTKDDEGRLFGHLVVNLSLERYLRPSAATGHPAPSSLEAPPLSPVHPCISSLIASRTFTKQSISHAMGVDSIPAHLTPGLRLSWHPQNLGQDVRPGSAITRNIEN